MESNEGMAGGAATAPASQETPAAASAAAAQDTTVSGTEGKAAEIPQGQPGLLNTQHKDPADPASGTTPAETTPAQQFAASDYDIDLSLPEGIVPNEALLGEFKEIAVGLQLPPEAAKKLLDLEVKNQQANIEQFIQKQNAWRAEIQTDPDFGGAKLEATVSDAQHALKTYDPDGGLLRELEAGGYGNHPGVIRFLARVGKSVKEDSVHTGREQKTDAPLPLRERLWPD